MRKLIFLLILTTSFSTLNSHSNLFNKLKEKSSLKKDEYLIVIYFQIGNCPKCLIEPFEIINQIEKSKKVGNVKFIALVRCDREIELKVFIRETDWKYYTFLDDGTARNNLGGEPSSIVTILNYKGNNILNCNNKEMNKNIKKINAFLKE
ncbi:MAG: hypothetical protein V1779_05435 [bacterium]